MGKFQLVTTSTMDRGSSTFSGLDTVRSLWAKEMQIHLASLPIRLLHFCLGYFLPQKHPLSSLYFL